LKQEWFKDAKAAFRKLDGKKQEKVIQACLDEFAEEGFETASTNRIAERAGIAKGSIFKYFGTKEKMFFTVINYILENYLETVKERLPEMPKGVLERYAAFVGDTYGFLGNDMKMYKAFSRIMSERGGELMLKIRKKWEPRIEPLMKELLAGSDTDKLGITMHEFAQLFTWLDNSIDQDVYSMINASTTPAEIKDMYKQRVDLVIKVLKHGIYK
jgi:TetR/AcrR family transcriptional regulator